MIEVPVRHLNHSIVPVIIGSIVDAEDIINAMELRCFGVGKRTWLIQLHPRSIDLCLIIFALFLFVAVTVLNVREALDRILVDQQAPLSETKPVGCTINYPVWCNGVPYVDSKVMGEQVVLQAHAAGEIDSTMFVQVMSTAPVHAPGQQMCLCNRFKLRLLQKMVAMSSRSGSAFLCP